MSSSNVSVEAWATHTGDHRLDNYPDGITGISGTLDSNANGGVGTAAAIEYSSNGPLSASWNRGTFTAPSDGTYVFKYSADQTTNGADRVHHYRLIKNGSTEVAAEEYTTNGPRTTGNEIFWIGDLLQSDTLAVHLGENHIASHIPESMFYTVTKILSVTNGPMETQQVFYDSLTTTQNLDNSNPVSIYQIDSNFKLTLDPGRYLLSYHFPVQGNSAVTTWLASSLVSGTAVANAVSSCLHNSRSLHSSSVIVNPGVTTDYTIWALPLNNSGTSEYFNTEIDSVEPKDIPHMNAIRLSASTVGDSGSVGYDNTISGLTSTNVKSAIDELANVKVSAPLTTITPVPPFDNVYICDTASGVVSVTLPEISTLTSNVKLIFKDNGNASGNIITINRSGSDMIDGSVSLVLNTNYESKTLVSDGGTNWLIV